jgi:hypothetical protein
MIFFNSSFSAASHAAGACRARIRGLSGALVSIIARRSAGMMKLFEHEAEGREVFLFDRAVIETVERFAQHGEGSAQPAGDDAIVPLICPTCQNVFAVKTSMPATPCYFAWGCFRYF